MDRPSKRVRLLSDASGSDSSDSNVKLQNDANGQLTVNDEYAKRFHHNKAREERQRLEEKYGKEEPVEDSDSESESEDDDALLATQQLDAEIFATLNAIKSKDPRVYDSTVTFYTPEDALDADDSANGMATKPKEKPVFLRDYHRKNLLSGGVTEENEDEALPTYDEEQSAVKRELLRQVKQIPGAGNEDGSGSDEEEFLVKKPGPKLQPPQQDLAGEVDITLADKDPETYLSNFMAARAWLPKGTSKFAAFESDDEDEDGQADAFEEAYNMRFEDPKRANEKLMSHSREAAAKYSVRRDEVKGRKKTRDLERAKKDAERLERDEDKARLRRLKIEEAQEKLVKFKEAAGLRGQVLPIDEWSKFLDDGWDDDKWEKEMTARFGESYYKDQDNDAETPATTRDSGKAKAAKAKKPSWSDDIDIADIVPDFDEEEQRQKVNFTLSDVDEDASDGGVELDAAELAEPSSKKKKNKEREKQRAEQKRQARKERQKLEELVDQKLITESLPVNGTSSKRDGGLFRYRETSPSTFGLSALDILMADDAQLNQFAGLKKLAAFRDVEKKRKDKKKLGKKERLRQWRKGTFGDETGPKASFQDYLDAHRAPKAAGGVGREDVAPPPPPQQQQEGEGNIVEGKSRKKRSRKRKAVDVGVAVDAGL